LTEFYITTERNFSPGPANCTWELLTAFPQSEAANLKFDGLFFTYVTLNCFRPGEIDEDWVLMEEWREGGLGYPVPNLLGWSADGKFMYFYDLIIPDGCSPPGGFQRDLRAVDLMTGEIRPIPIVLTSGFSLSPDTSRVSYYRWEEKEVGVYTFASGDEQRFPFDIPDNLSDWYAETLPGHRRGRACCSSSSTAMPVSRQGARSTGSISRQVWSVPLWRKTGG